MGDKEKSVVQVWNIFCDGTAQAEATGYLPKQGFPDEVKHIFGELSRKGAEDSAKRQKIL